MDWAAEKLHLSHLPTSHARIMVREGESRREGRKERKDTTDKLKGVAILSSFRCCS